MQPTAAHRPVGNKANAVMSMILHLNSMVPSLNIHAVLEVCRRLVRWHAQFPYYQPTGLTRQIAMDGNLRSDVFDVLCLVVHEGVDPIDVLQKSS